MALPGVVGVGQGEHNGSPCIMVFILRKTSEIMRDIPTVLEGYTVIVEETGEFKAL